MNETKLLAEIYGTWRAGKAPPHVVVGPGDDAAVIRCGPGRFILATVDHCIEGRHTAPGTPLALFARKALARSISDIAAMGCRVEGGAALATAAFPDGYPEERAAALAQALRVSAEELGFPLVGGDIASLGVSDAPLTVTATVLAQTGEAPILRSGAAAGDGLYVTGALGGSWRTAKHLEFAPRIAEAAALRASLGGRLHAMMDISDGLGRDAGRLAAAACVRIEIDAGVLPMNLGRDWRSAMADGEDYELLFAAEDGTPPASVEGTRITRIGSVSAGAGCFVRAPSGEVVDATAMGFEHT